MFYLNLQDNWKLRVKIPSNLPLNWGVSLTFCSLPSLSFSLSSSLHISFVLCSSIIMPFKNSSQPSKDL